MTQQPETTIANLHYLTHSAIITARMPTLDECADGYPADAPVLVVTRPGAQLAAGTARPHATVFPAAAVAIAVGDPEGTPGGTEVTDAAAEIFGMIAEDLESTRQKMAMLAAAARTSPGAITRLAGQLRHERDMEMFCADADSCEHAARAAAGPGDAAQDTREAAPALAAP